MVVDIVHWAVVVALTLLLAHQKKHNRLTEPCFFEIILVLRKERVGMYNISSLSHFLHRLFPSFVLISCDCIFNGLNLSCNPFKWSLLMRSSEFQTQKREVPRTMCRRSMWWRCIYFRIYCHTKGIGSSIRRWHALPTRFRRLYLCDRRCEILLMGHNNTLSDQTLFKQI